MKNILLFAALLLYFQASSQTYADSIKTYISNYVQTHEVVKGHDKSHMKFYDVGKSFRVVADFKPSPSAEWLTFKTSGPKNKVFKLYGTLSFTLNDQLHSLNIYQSQELMTNDKYKNYLFLPFTDSTSGIETYEGGRYIDLQTTDIRNGKLILDFNKAYNPYCAYVSGVYNCPIPPKENALSIAINAGEKTFSNSH